MPPSARAALLVVAFCAGLTTSAGAAPCQPTEAGNLFLVGCDPFADTCTIHDVPLDCELDVGDRAVVIDAGQFNAGGKTITIRAGSIRVAAALQATSGPQAGGMIALTARRDLVVEAPVVASGNSAGRIRLGAGGSISIRASGTLVARATRTVADGGTIDVVAGAGIAQDGAIVVAGGTQGAGGGLALRAGTDVRIGAAIDATGGTGSGGDVEVAAGDDVSVERAIDVTSVSGGGGGLITIRAGEDVRGGIRSGGTLTVAGDLTADGDRDSEGGQEGGAIELHAFGDVTVSSTVQATGGSPDGGGGAVVIDSGDDALGRVTERDGDLTITGTIDVHAPINGADATGGDVDLGAGRDGTITGTIDVSGSDGGGDLDVIAGHALAFGAVVDAHGAAADGSGGTITLTSGTAKAGRLAVSERLDVSAGDTPAGGRVLLAGCDLELAPSMQIDAAAQSTNGAPKIDLVSNGALTVGASGRYDAQPHGRIALVHHPGVTPAVGAGVVFAPAVLDVTTSTLFPACPMCGDGVVQPGEPCDTGTVDGACCSADCNALLCPTPTVAPSATTTPTAANPQPTPSSTPGAPAATATSSPGLPLLDRKALVACQQTVAAAANELVLGTLRTLEACGLDGFTCLQTRTPGAALDACYAATQRRCAAKLDKLERAHAKFRSRFDGACGGTPVDLLRSVDALGFQLLEPYCFGVDLSSPQLVLGCLQVAPPCEVARALGVAVPRIGDLLAAVGAERGGCLPPPTGHPEGLGGGPSAPATVRCQRTVAGAARKLLARQLSVARGCVGTLFKCRVGGKPFDACRKLGAACARKLTALADPASGPRAKALGAIGKSCGTLPTAALYDLAGIGYAAVDDRCLALGVDASADVEAVATCVTRAYGCAGSRVVHETLPLVDDELARVGVALADDPFCASPTPTATPSATPTATSTPSGTPTPPPATPLPGETATPTPLPTPTPVATPKCGNGVLDAGEQCDLGDAVPGDGCGPSCRFEQLVPGGGPNDDCIAEWAVIDPFNAPPLGPDGLPSTTQSCVDGDPSCDADHDPDTCTFRVALCLQNVDPNLPGCVLPPGIARFVLTSPRPDASDTIDAGNGLRLMDAFRRLSAVAPDGVSGNTLVFEPPLVVAAPDNCTDTTSLIVKRRGFAERSEKFRIVTTAAPLAAGRDDNDTLVLTCRAPVPPP